MRNWWIGCLLLCGAGLAGCGPAPAAAPLAGNWKVVVVSEGKEITLAVVRVEERDGKPGVVVLGPASLKDAPLQDVAVEDRSLRFTLSLRGTPFRLVGHAPKGEDRPKKLLGCVQPPGGAEPLILEQTDKTDVAKKDAVKDAPGFEDLERLLGIEDLKKREAGLKQLRKKHAGEPVALVASEVMLETAVKDGAAAPRVRELAGQYLEDAAVYGPEMESHAALQVARGLLQARGDAGLAAEYARKAEKLLAPADPLDKHAAVLKALARALTKGGKADEAKDVEARLAKVDAQLDEEFAKTAVPFKVEAPRRRPSGDRVVLLELFTGAQCPPCVAADVAFDAVLRAYRPRDVVLLQYHLHIPGPDPLTNADSEARAEFYGKDVEGTPSAFLDGKPTESLGGGRGNGEESYDILRKQLDVQLRKDAGAALKLDVRRSGDRLDLGAEVADLAKTGDRVRLRFVLVEEVVRYAGRNRQRLHHHVVRAFPGGVKGFALLDATAKKKASVNLADLRKALGDYLDRSAKENPFPDDDRPLDLKRLKVVAFIQDDKSREVYQAAQADVPETE